MIGLYFNVDAPKVNELLSVYQEIFRFPVWVGHGAVIDLAGASTTWSDEASGLFFALAGWCMSDGELLCVGELANRYQKCGISALNDLDGVFVIFIFERGVIHIIGDNKSLLPVFWGAKDGRLYVAPSAKIVACATNAVTDLRTLDFLKQQGHMVGDLTQWGGVKRLGIFSYLKGCDELQRTPSYLGAKICVGKVEDVPSYIRELSSLWPRRKCCLPLSGGLDSRLILACSSVVAGYCYGPVNSGDRPIARKFSHQFDKFEEYDYVFHGRNNNVLKQFVESAMEGVTTDSESAALLFDNYLEARSRLSFNVVFDGYLGDVLQRGTYLYWRGIVAEAFRFFPILYCLIRTRDLWLLNRRYKNLGSEQRKMLIDEYTLFKSRSKLSNELATLVAFEFLRGRGFGLINYGGILLQSQFARVVPVFAMGRLFSVLINSDPVLGVRFSLIKRIWKFVPREYKVIRFENGYNMFTPSWLMPKLALCWRFLIHFVPGYQNYGTALKRRVVKGRGGIV